MNQLTGIIWKWEKSHFNDAKSVAVTDSNQYLIEFLTSSQLAIKADCNRVGGHYIGEGRNLTIQLGPSTLVACPPDSQAGEFLKGLADVGSYLFADGKLILELKLDIGAMTFAASDPTALTGTSWQLAGINNGKQAVVSLINGTSVTLNFGTDGQVRGSTGCNSYSGAYEATGDQLKVGPLAATRKMWATPAGIMEQEAQFLAALQAGTTFKITGTQLVIRDAAGAMQVTAIQ